VWERVSVKLTRSDNKAAAHRCSHSFCSRHKTGVIDVVQISMKVLSILSDVTNLVEFKQNQVFRMFNCRVQQTSQLSLYTSTIACGFEETNSKDN